MQSVFRLYANWGKCLSNACRDGNERKCLRLLCKRKHLMNHDFGKDNR